MWKTAPGRVPASLSMIVTSFDGLYFLLSQVKPPPQDRTFIRHFLRSDRSCIINLAIMKLRILMLIVIPSENECTSLQLPITFLRFTV
jgi:hypothetical protein